MVSESVERAVGILEQPQPDDAKYLFTALSATMGSCGTDRSRSVTIKCSNKNLNEFVDWINTYCAAHNRGRRHPARQAATLAAKQRPVPSHPGVVHRRPGGAIAGTIQYRHHSIQSFEGYAGTSESGFRGEVEAEQSLQRGERRLAMIENHEHHGLRGPAAPEAEERLNNLQRSRVHFGASPLEWSLLVLAVDAGQISSWSCSASRRTATLSNVDLSSTFGACWRTALRHSDVLTMTGLDGADAV